jgi:hypothetical protein
MQTTEIFECGPPPRRRSQPREAQESHYSDPDFSEKIPDGANKSKPALDLTEKSEKSPAVATLPAPSKPQAQAARRPGRPRNSQLLKSTVGGQLRLPVVPGLRVAEAVTHLPPDVFKKCKAMGCSAFSTNNSVNLDELFLFLSTKGVFVFHDAATPDDVSMMTFQQRDDRAQALIREHQLAVRQESVISKNEVTGAVAKGQGLLFDLIDRKFTIELPPALKGLDEAQIQRELIASAESFKKVLREELSKFQNDSVNKNQPIEKKT